MTDLPIRFSYYPYQTVNPSESGIILASYTWEDDATLWDILPEKIVYKTH